MQIGSFKLLKLLGEGSFGRTYLGEHALLKTKVCAKQEKTREPIYMAMFKAEADVVARLRHPSLPSLMDYVESTNPDIGQMMFLSYIEGLPLDKDVQKNGPIDDEHVCWIIDRMLGACSYLHGKHQMVHCDIKPANAIMDVDDHNVTLVDLGMACLKPDERSLALGGTPDFMPPEFMQGLPPIPASDIYSIGKTAMFLAGGNVSQGTCPADMHPELVKFIDTLTRRDPTQRPQDTDTVRMNLLALRKRIFGRDSCREVMKRRH